MNKYILILFFLFFAFQGNAQAVDTLAGLPDSSKKVLVVKTACGQCMFGMKADGCTLAVQIKGKKYFVEGSAIDDHGDAHAADGFCSAIRKAEVQGEVMNGKFIVTYYKLLPLTNKKIAGH